MGKVKKTKKFGAVKRMIQANDPRLNKGKVTEEKAKPETTVRHVDKPSSALFFKYKKSAAVTSTTAADESN